MLTCGPILAKPSLAARSRGVAVSNSLPWSGAGSSLGTHRVRKVLLRIPVEMGMPIRISAVQTWQTFSLGKARAHQGRHRERPSIVLGYGLRVQGLEEHVDDGCLEGLQEPLVVEKGQLSHLMTVSRLKLT